jgi:hypothetical protein
MTVSNGDVMRRLNEWAEQQDLPLLVQRTRIEHRPHPAGGMCEVAVFTLTMPDFDDTELRMTTEVTGRQLRVLWAGIQLAAEGTASWLPWDRETPAVAS